MNSSDDRSLPPGERDDGNVSATIRGDAVVDATSRGSIPTEGGVRATVRGDGAGASIRPGESLPAQLNEQYTVVRPLPSGTEAEVLLCRCNKDGSEVVIKWYRAGFAFNEGVLKALQGANDDEVAHLREWDRAEGRCYEIFDYLPGGSLKALMERDGPLFSPGFIRDVVAELVKALQYLSDRTAERGQRFVHGDLKPDNILVRRREPLDLVLADFGGSMITAHTANFVQAKDQLFSFPYVAPEVLHERPFARKSDLWSVGVIAYELATGSNPLAELTDPRAVAWQVTFGEAFPIDDLADARLRLLCRGLLVARPEDRWDLQQVTEWLDGGTPAVALPERALEASGSRRPFEFKGIEYHDPRSLVLAMAASWDDGVGVFRGPGGRKALHDYLEANADREAVRDLLAELHGKDSIPPDTRMVMMLVALAPDIELLPFRTWDLSGDGLVGLARDALAQGPSSPAGRAVEALRHQKLLDHYRRMAGGASLEGVVARWTEATKNFSQMVSTSRDNRPPLSGDAAQLASPQLLLGAADTESEQAMVERALGLLQTEDPDLPDWFVGLHRDLQQADGDSGAACGAATAVLALQPLAEEHAAERVQHRQQAAADRRRRRSGAIGRHVASLPVYAIAAAPLGLAAGLLSWNWLFANPDTARSFGVTVAVWLAAAWWLCDLIHVAWYSERPRAGNWTRVAVLVGAGIGVLLAWSSAPASNEEVKASVGGILAVPAGALIGHSATLALRWRRAEMLALRLGLLLAVLVIALAALLGPIETRFEEQDVLLSPSDQNGALLDAMGAIEPTAREQALRFVVGVPEGFTQLGLSAYEDHPEDYLAALGVARFGESAIVFYSAGGQADMVGAEAMCLTATDGTQMPLIAVDPQLTSNSELYRGTAVFSPVPPGTYQLSWACVRYTSVPVQL
jgi:serine/threonine protein kinase